MKKIVINSMFIIFILNYSFSQSQVSKQSENILVNSSAKTFDNRSRDVEGSPYINEGFTSAKISNISKPYPLRYNAYQDEMEFKSNGEVRDLLKNQDYTITFINENKVYKVFNYNKSNKPLEGFFVILNSGNNITLLLKEIVKYYDEISGDNGIATYEPPKLKRSKDQAFYSMDQTSAIEVPTKKKGFYKLFSEKSKEVEKFVKTQQLSIKDQSDLIRIFEYYNTL